MGFSQKYNENRSKFNKSIYIYNIPSSQLKCDKLVTFWPLEVTIIARIAQFVFYIEGKGCITKLSRLKSLKTQCKYLKIVHQGAFIVFLLCSYKCDKPKKFAIIKSTGGDFQLASVFTISDEITEPFIAMAR